MIFNRKVTHINVTPDVLDLFFGDIHAKQAHCQPYSHAIIDRHESGTHARLDDGRRPGYVDFGVQGLHCSHPGLCVRPCLTVSQFLCLGFTNHQGCVLTGSCRNSPSPFCIGQAGSHNTEAMSSQAAAHADPREERKAVTVGM